MSEITMTAAQYQNCITQAVAAAMKMVLGKQQNLDNRMTWEQTPFQEENEMAKIRRTVTIDGHPKWIRAENEQDYAEKLMKLMKGTQENADPQEAHLFSDYAWEWFNVFSKPNVCQTTALNYRRALDNHILPAFEGMTVESITAADVQRLFNAMDDDGRKTLASKLRVKTVLGMILKRAVDEDIIRKNPLVHSSVRIKGNASEETPPYTLEQMRYLVNHIGDVKNPVYRNFFAIMTVHPLRLEEALGLRWKDVDMAGGDIHIRNVVTHPDRNKAVFEERTKTVSSRRKVKLVQEIVPYLTVGKPEEFVIGGQKPLSYEQTKYMYKRIKADTGFDERITPRRFRTTVLTDIYQFTKDIKQTQKAAGHTTAVMTLKHYIKGRDSIMDTASPIASAYGLHRTEIATGIV